MSFLTLGEITEILGGEFVGDHSLLTTKVDEVASLLGESKSIKSNNNDSTDHKKNRLYFPNDAVKQPYYQRAKEDGFFCSVQNGKFHDITEPYILINDDKLQKALVKFTQNLREMVSNKTVIAVTGSVGKTTTVNMLCSILREQFVISNSYFSENIISHRVRAMYEMLSDTVEIGIFEVVENMVRASELELSLNSLMPNTGAITRISETHLAEPGNSVEKIINTMTKFANYFSNNPNAVYINASCENCKLIELTRENVVYINDNKIYATNIELKGLEGTSCDLIINDTTVPVVIPIIGRQFIQTALTCAKIALDLGLSSSQIKNGIANFQPEGLRSQIHRTPFIDIIEDVANSSPASMEAAIDTLQTIHGKRKVLIFGDMADLGEQDMLYHKKIAEYTIDKDIDLTIYIGKYTEEMEYIFTNAGMDVKCYKDRYKLHFDLPDLIKQDDVVLLKAAKILRFNHVTNVLLSLSYKNKAQKIPLVRAENVAIMDLTGNIIFDKNMHVKCPPAAITKILTCLIALERMDIHDTLTIVELVHFGSRLKRITINEKFKVLDALYALMIHNANDIAVNIAINIAGKTHDFVKLMNKRAESLGMKNSIFKNPHGINEDGHLSTAYDLCLLMRQAMENPTFRKIIKTREHKCFSSANSYTFRQTNELILVKSENPERHYQASLGGKTGRFKADRNFIGTFVSSAEREGQSNIVVQLSVSGEDFDEISIKFDDAKRLHEYAFKLQSKIN